MVDLTTDERKLLLEMINAVSIPGRAAEQIVEIKRKMAMEEGVQTSNGGMSGDPNMRFKKPKEARPATP